MHLTEEEKKSLTAMILAVPLENWKSRSPESSQQSWGDVFFYTTTVKGVQTQVRHAIKNDDGINYLANRRNIKKIFIEVELDGERVEEELRFELASLVCQLRKMFKLLTSSEIRAEELVKKAAREAIRKKELLDQLGIKG